MSQTCNGCDGSKEKNVPYIVVEGIEARRERRDRRIITALVSITITFILAFTGFAIYTQWMWSQFEVVDESESVSIDSHEGTANYVGNDGDIINGKD